MIFFFIIFWMSTCDVPHLLHYKFKYHNHHLEQNTTKPLTPTILSPQCHHHAITMSLHSFSLLGSSNRRSLFPFNSAALSPSVGSSRSCENNRSVRLQGLQASRRRAAPRKGDWRNLGGERTLHSSGSLRMSGTTKNMMHIAYYTMGLASLILLVYEVENVRSLTLSFILYQGECGYGPNLLIDGKIFNNVKGREAVLKALGIEE
jgi:hypothetical protein